MRSWCACLLGIGLLLSGCAPDSGTTASGSSSSATARVTQTPAPCVERWQLSPVLVPPGDDPALTGLAGVVAISASDVWAVGRAGARSATGIRGEAPTTTLAEHWDGRAWSIVPVPDARAASVIGDGLTAVSGRTADDVWAVGSAGSPGDGGSQPGAYDTIQTLIEHWDGTRWSIVTAPDVAPRQGEPGYDQLTGVVALSRSDVWAVGATEWSLDGGAAIAAQPLVEHWNGSAWSIVPVPDPVAVPPDAELGPQSRYQGTPIVGGYAALLGVGAGPRGDVWAVGEYNTGTDGYSTTSKTLSEHWDGSSWRIVPAPDATLQQPLLNGGTGANDALTAVAASPAGDLWAVGEALPAGGLTLHRTASSWLPVTSPAVGHVSNGIDYGVPFSAHSLRLEPSPLNSVVALAAADAWAVGSVILHWDGRQWLPLYTLDGMPYGYLFGVAVTSPADLWAVGDRAIVHRTCTA